MLGSILGWIVGQVGKKLPTELERGIEDVIKAGQFAAGVASLQVGQQATAPTVQDDILGKSYEVTVIFKRTA